MTNRDFLKALSDGSGIAHIQVPTLLTDQNYVLPVTGGTLLTDASIIGATCLDDRKVHVGSDNRLIFITSLK